MFSHFLFVLESEKRNHDDVCAWAKELLVQTFLEATILHRKILSYRELYVDFFICFFKV